MNKTKEIDYSLITLEVFDILKKITESMNIDDTSRYNKRYVGKVVSLDEDTKTKNIKVLVYGVYDDIPEADIPWAEPINAGMAGSSFILPEIGSLVNITFIADDIYRPAYTSSVSSAKDVYGIDGSSRAAMYHHHPGGDVMVLFENEDNVLEFNKVTSSISYRNSSGMIFSLNGLGREDDGAAPAEQDPNSFAMSVGGDGDEFNLIIKPGYVAITSGDTSAPAEIRIEDGCINLVADDGSVSIGTTTNKTTFDEASTMRYTSPGAVVPDAAKMGPYCAIPVCPLTGAPHQGNMYTVTNPPAKEVTPDSSDRAIS